MHTRIQYSPRIRVLERNTRFDAFDPTQQVRLRLVVGVPEPERHDAELWGPAHLEQRIVHEARMDHLGQVELLVEGLAEGRDPVQDEREPHTETSNTPGELGRQITVVRQIAGGRQVLEVGRALEVRVAEGVAVADHQSARPVREEEPLVRIERDAVGSLDPDEPLAAAFGEPEEAAVRGVDVDPQALAPGDVGDRGQRVDRPGVGGACCGADQERTPASGAILVDHRLERAGVHPQRARPWARSVRGAWRSRRSSRPSCCSRGSGR